MCTPFGIARDSATRSSRAGRSHHGITPEGVCCMYWILDPTISRAGIQYILLLSSGIYTEPLPPKSSPQTSPSSIGAPLLCLCQRSRKAYTSRLAMHFVVARVFFVPDVAVLYNRACTRVEPWFRIFTLRLWTGPPHFESSYWGRGKMKTFSVSTF